MRVLIVGGGPAGAVAARDLARAGIETTLIERAPHGAKPCGGAVSFAAFGEFGIPSSVIERRPRGRAHLLRDTGMDGAFAGARRPLRGSVRVPFPGGRVARLLRLGFSQEGDAHGWDGDRALAGEDASQTPRGVQAVGRARSRGQTGPPPRSLSDPDWPDRPDWDDASVPVSSSPFTG
ncbi:MAG: FAD-dependent monooxygenase [Nitrospirae bacterium]|nr:FAD-dependent monooxygenase [Nitrospirota bacterium]